MEKLNLKISDYTMLPDTAKLSDRLRVCLQEGDENPRDFTTLFDMSVFKLDTMALPKVITSVLDQKCLLLSERWILSTKETRI